METKSSKKYSVYAKLNGKSFNIQSDSLKDAFIAMKSEVPTLKTKIFLKIESKEGVCNKVVMPQKGRLLFNRTGFLDAFISNLIFKPNV